MRLSIIIPLRDEEENVRRLQEELPPALESIPGLEEFEVICVDDGSRDATRARLDAIPDRRFRAVSFDRGHGQTAAIAAGVSLARFEILGIIDGDLQTDPCDFALLLAKMAEGYDCVSGSRIERRDSLLKRISTWTARTVRQRVLGDRYHDITCPLKVVERRCLERLTFYDTFHRFIPYLVEMQGYRVAEVPVSHRPRLAGKTHYGVGNRLMVGIGSMLALRWMGRNILRWRLTERNGAAPAGGARP